MSLVVERYRTRRHEHKGQKDVGIVSELQRDSLEPTVASCWAGVQRELGLSPGIPAREKDFSDFGLWIAAERRPCRSCG